MRHVEKEKTVTQDVGGEFPEADVAATLFLTELQHLRQEVVRIESHRRHDRQAHKSHSPTQSSKRKRQS